MNRRTKLDQYQSLREYLDTRNRKRIETEVNEQIAEDLYWNFRSRVAHARNDDENDRVARDADRSRTERRTAAIAINDPVRRRSAHSFVKATIDLENRREMRIRTAKATAAAVALTALIGYASTPLVEKGIRILFEIREMNR